MSENNEIEDSNKIKRDVEMLLNFVNNQKMSDLRNESKIRYTSGKKNGELTENAVNARTEYVKECAKSFETFYYRKKEKKNFEPKTYFKLYIIDKIMSLLLVYTSFLTSFSHAAKSSSVSPSFIATDPLN